MSKGFDLIGDKELQRLLQQLPSEVGKKRIWRAVARAGAKPIIESARSKVPKVTGNLKRAIKYKNYSRAVEILGGYVSINKKDWKERIKGVVLAKGAKKDRTRKNGGSTGNIKQPIRDFIKEAAEDSGIESIAAMERKIIPAIQKEIKKLL